MHKVYISIYTYSVIYRNIDIFQYLEPFHVVSKY